MIDAFAQAQQAYNKEQDSTDVVKKLCVAALRLLDSATASPLPTISVLRKNYWIYRTTKGVSRPYLPTLFINDPEKLSSEWSKLLDACRADVHRIDLDAETINRILYTIVASFCICIDLWQPGSRKTPGTQFEVVMGTIIRKLLPQFAMSKHVLLPGEEESVSTDIVATHPNGEFSLVFPAKITTRERIVQPFAHQRILNSVFGDGKYRSVIICVSEMQREEEKTAKEICVPGTIRLYQKHLAPVSGIYYLDPPNRYLQKDLTDLVRVGSVGELFATDLANLVQNYVP